MRHNASTMATNYTHYFFFAGCSSKIQRLTASRSVQPSTSLLIYLRSDLYRRISYKSPSSIDVTDLKSAKIHAVDKEDGVFKLPFSTSSSHDASASHDSTGSEIVNDIQATIPSRFLSTPSSTLSSFAPPLSSAPSSSFSHDKNFFERLQDLWSERSGTSEILSLKESVNEASNAFDQASKEVTYARRHLDESLRAWERTSGQHLQLLQRREYWTTEDAQQFADLVAKEISSRNALEKAREDLATTEETLSKRQLEYMNRMRRRYHEEQIWQDQWRVLGTYGTWSLIVLNSCVFLASQYFLQLREYARMKVIEQLIQEKMVAPAVIPLSTDTSRDSDPNANSRNDISESGVAEALEVNNSHQIDQTVNSEMEHQGQLLSEVKDTCLETKKQQSTSETAASKRNYNGSESLKDTIIVKWQLFTALFRDAWHELQSTSSDDFQKIKNEAQLKTKQLVSSISHIDDVPKSLSELHVPSAIIGATLTGITVLIIMAIFPTRRK